MDKIKHMTWKWMAMARPCEGAMKKPRGEMEKALASTAEVTKVVILQASQAMKPREEALEPGLILLEIPSMLSSPKASSLKKPEKTQPRLRPLP